MQATIAIGVHPFPQCRHRENRFPSGKTIHAASSTTTPPYKHPQSCLRRWLERQHRDGRFHFTPTSASWQSTRSKAFSRPHKAATKARRAFESVASTASRDQPLPRRAQSRKSRSRFTTWTADPERNHRRRQARVLQALRSDPLGCAPASPSRQLTQTEQPRSSPSFQRAATAERSSTLTRKSKPR